MKFSELMASEADEYGFSDTVWATFRELVDPEVVVRLTIPGDPASKSRPRFTGKDSKKRAYTPDKVKQAEETIGWHFRKARPDWRTPDGEGAFGVFAVFFTKNHQRRDVDNMLKLVLDACNKLVWIDDVQVSEVTGRVVRGVDDPSTEIVIYRVWRTSEAPSYERSCEECGEVFRTYRAWGKRRFCSRRCASKNLWRTRSLKCAQCGAEYVRKPSQPGKFCSVRCSSAARRTTVMCTGCGVEFTKQRCHVRSSNFCSTECRESHWREHRKAAAKGVCETCGGPTSKKTYRQCRPCKLAGTALPGKPKSAPEITELPKETSR